MKLTTIWDKTFFVKDTKKNKKGIYYLGDYVWYHESLIKNLPKKTKQEKNKPEKTKPEKIKLKTNKYQLND